MLDIYFVGNKLKHRTKKLLSIWLTDRVWRVISKHSSSGNHFVLLSWQHLNSREQEQLKHRF